MIFNTTVQDLTFEPFLNISKDYLLVWAVINFLKCLYVTISIVNKRIPPLVVAAIFTGVTVVYTFYTRAFSWLLILQMLDILLIMYTVLNTRDGIFLLALLSATIYFLKPIGFTVDVFVVLFMLIDIVVMLYVNPLVWSLLYVNCLVVSMFVANWNSHALGPYMFLPSCVYICYFWAICWNATDIMRVMPVFVAVVVYVLEHFIRQDPMISSSQIYELSSKLLKF